MTPYLIGAEPRKPDGFCMNRQRSDVCMNLERKVLIFYLSIQQVMDI